MGNEGFCIDGLTVILLFSSFLYIICLLLLRRKWDLLNKIGRELSTKKLLLLSVGLVCAIRIMSFVGIAALNIANVRAHYSMKKIARYQSRDENQNDSPSNQDKYQAFYDGSMTVMFDLPNCMIVSTYVLLTLVWTECFIQSKFHNENARDYRQKVLSGYMLFNAALYGTQTTLYILIFATSSSNVVRNVLYATVTGVNFIAVSLVCFLYIYLNIQFSGYPFRSPFLLKSLSKISQLMAVWSLTRIIWGIAMLLVYIYDVELLQDSNTPIWSFMLLFLLFVICEIFPIFAMLDYSFMNIVGFESRASNDRNNLASERLGYSSGEWKVPDLENTINLGTEKEQLKRDTDALYGPSSISNPNLPLLDAGS